MLHLLLLVFTDLVSGISFNTPNDIKPTAGMDYCYGAAIIDFDHPEKPLMFPCLDAQFVASRDHSKVRMRELPFTSAIHGRYVPLFTMADEYWGDVSGFGYGPNPWQIVNDTLYGNRYDCRDPESWYGPGGSTLEGVTACLGLYAYASYGYDDGFVTAMSATYGWAGIWGASGFSVVADKCSPTVGATCITTGYPTLIVPQDFDATSTTSPSTTATSTTASSSTGSTIPSTTNTATTFSSSTATTTTDPVTTTKGARRRDVHRRSGPTFSFSARYGIFLPATGPFVKVNNFTVVPISSYDPTHTDVPVYTLSRNQFSVTTLGAPSSGFCDFSGSSKCAAGKLASVPWHDGNLVNTYDSPTREWLRGGWLSLVTVLQMRSNATTYVIDDCARICSELFSIGGSSPTWTVPGSFQSLTLGNYAATVWMIGFHAEVLPANCVNSTTVNLTNCRVGDTTMAAAHCINSNMTAMNCVGRNETMTVVDTTNSTTDPTDWGFPVVNGLDVLVVGSTPYLSVYINGTHCRCAVLVGSEETSLYNGQCAGSPWRYVAASSPYAYDVDIRVSCTEGTYIGKLFIPSTSCTTNLSFWDTGYYAQVKCLSPTTANTLSIIAYVLIGLAIYVFLIVLARTGRMIWGTKQTITTIWALIAFVWYVFYMTLRAILFFLLLPFIAVWKLVRFGANQNIYTPVLRTLPMLMFGCMICSAQLLPAGAAYVPPPPFTSLAKEYFPIGDSSECSDAAYTLIQRAASQTSQSQVIASSDTTVFCGGTPDDPTGCKVTSTLSSIMTLDGTPLVIVVDNVTIAGVSFKVRPLRVVILMAGYTVKLVSTDSYNTFMDYSYGVPFQNWWCGDSEFCPYRDSSGTTCAQPYIWAVAQVSTCGCANSYDACVGVRGDSDHSSCVCTTMLPTNPQAEYIVGTMNGGVGSAELVTAIVNVDNTLSIACAKVILGTHGVALNLTLPWGEIDIQVGAFSGLDINRELNIIFPRQSANDMSTYRFYPDGVCNPFGQGRNGECGWLQWVNSYSVNPNSAVQPISSANCPIHQTPQRQGAGGSYPTGGVNIDQQCSWFPATDLEHHPFQSAVNYFADQIQAAQCLSIFDTSQRLSCEFNFTSAVASSIMTLTLDGIDVAIQHSYIRPKILSTNATGCVNCDTHARCCVTAITKDNVPGVATLTCSGEFMTSSPGTCVIGTNVTLCCVNAVIGSLIGTYTATLSADTISTMEGNYNATEDNSTDPSGGGHSHTSGGGGTGGGCDFFCDMCDSLGWLSASMCDWSEIFGALMSMVILVVLFIIFVAMLPYLIPLGIALMSWAFYGILYILSLAGVVEKPKRPVKSKSKQT